LPDPKRKDPSQKTPPEKFGLWRTFAVWVIIFLAIAIFWKVFLQKKGVEAEIPFSRFQEEIVSKNVRTVSIVEKQIEGELFSEITVTAGQKQVKVTRFKTYVPFEDAELVRELVREGVEVKSKPASNVWTLMLPWLLPILLLVAIYIFMFRQMQSGPNRAFTFGKSRARLTDR